MSTCASPFFYIVFIEPLHCIIYFYVFLYFLLIFTYFSFFCISPPIHMYLFPSRNISYNIKHAVHSMTIHLCTACYFTKINKIFYIECNFLIRQSISYLCQFVGFFAVNGKRLSNCKLFDLPNLSSDNSIYNKNNN